MSISIDIEFIMIPPDFGGRKHPFTENMYIHLRWQRYFDQVTNSVRSIRFIKIDYDQSTRLGHANCIFPFDDPFPETWLKIDELIELCDGHHVVAIGKIIGLGNNLA